jgi:hypothetical protein
MRLLTHDDNGKLALRTFDSNNLPSYAILSHTWYIDNSKEVTFQDLEAGRAQDKAGYGYNKIQFCARQATADGLQYFWVDTCCIDKSSSAELTEAINSMFQWYQHSSKCYVYLSDVSSSLPAREEAFQSSLWFSRGWTLQELIAPKVVEFFTSDGLRLGDKPSLEATIHKTTGIPIEALRDRPLSNFGIEERFSWAASRQTNRPEDKAYCLLGIFGVSMPVIYGEGEEKAIVRLRELVEKPKKYSTFFCCLFDVLILLVSLVSSLANCLGPEVPPSIPTTTITSRDATETRE